MKYDKELVQRIEDWVSENGLIKDGGATLRKFCEVFHIDNKTYYRWLDVAEFSDALTRARERYRSTLEEIAVPSLLTLVQGKTTKTTITEYIDDPANPDAPKVKKMTVKEIEHEPNLGAIQYLLNNRNKEDWASTQNIDAKISGDGLRIVVSDQEEAELINQLKENNINNEDSDSEEDE